LFDVESQIFVTMATRVALHGVNSNDAIKLHYLENPMFGARFMTISYNKPSYSLFCVKMPNFWLPWQQGSIWDKFQ